MLLISFNKVKKGLKFRQDYILTYGRKESLIKTYISNKQKDIFI